jgi:signal peptidase I
MFIFIASLTVISALFISYSRVLFYQKVTKPKWLDHLQYASVFAGAYVIIQLSNASTFLSIAAVTLTLAHLYDRLLCSQKPDKEVAMIVGVSREMWLFVLIFCLFRALIYDYSAVPSGSMEPTLYAGDLLAINKSAYYSKIPPFQTPLFNISQPKAGDVIVFLSPEDKNMHYIKRVIAGPGDHVVYKDKQYTINGKTAEFSEESLQENNDHWLSTYNENLSGVQHAVQIDQRTYNRNDVDLVVPKGHYFVSGDNRDFSYDSRYFGPIHQDLIVGKATHIITQFSYPIPLSFSRSGRIA